MDKTEWRVPAKWTNDCQGKKDYDGALVSLSTRYWPLGGGFHIFDETVGEFLVSPSNCPPSAKASILLHDGTDDDTVVMIEQEFKAATEDEVKRQVEVWAAEQYARVVRTILQEFGPAGRP